jgi:hypothetical protein
MSALLVRGELESDRLRYLLEEEWTDFSREFGVHPIPEHQDLRAFFIAWLGVFLPELYDDSLVSELEKWTDNIHRRDDYKYYGWYAVLPIEIALFVLSDNDDYWLRSHYNNIDHGKSSLRLFVLKSLALVADRIDFRNYELLARIEHNLAVRHNWSDYAVVIAATAKGISEEKKNIFQNWLERYSHNDDEKNTIECLIKFGYAANPFLSHFLWIQQYITIKLSSIPRNIMSQQRHLFQNKMMVDMWDRMQKHPLMKSHIFLGHPLE